MSGLNGEDLDYAYKVQKERYPEYLEEMYETAKRLEVVVPNEDTSPPPTSSPPPPRPTPPPAKPPTTWDYLFGTVFGGGFELSIGVGQKNRFRITLPSAMSILTLIVCAVIMVLRLSSGPTALGFCLLASLVVVWLTWSGHVSSVYSIFYQAALLVIPLSLLLVVDTIHSVDHILLYVLGCAAAIGAGMALINKIRPT